MDAELIPVELAQADTPAAVSQVFLDSAGSSLPPRPVVDEVVAHLRREAEVGGYRAYEERLEELEEGYGLTAEFFGCDPDEIAFTDSASRSWLALLDAVPLGPGDRILTTEVEYGGNAIALLNLAQQAGATVELVPSGADGVLDLQALRDTLDERVKLVSLVHVPTNGGVVSPVAAAAAAAKEVGALVLLDACQSIGQLPVTFAGTGADMITGTGRKWLRGPRGTGLLAVRRAALAQLKPRLIDLQGATWTGPDKIDIRADARVFELWENPVAERLGLLVALRYALDLGLDRIAATVTARADQLRAGLAALPRVTVRDLGSAPSGIVSFTVDGMAPEAVKAALAERDITVTVSRVTSTRYDMTRRGLEQVVRASPHYFVADGQVDRAVDAVARL
ncbi:aminotransferase class V-fold PLP-dependent enzyme [Actinokineospora diospyrosa]|uniref:Probable hercynylcysteine sulfoxide lyase n=1 Tax=Actinokineospora diospyrosa TaxID=103728 RepID=A0ABT1IK53_9PSEU|nr:aminotransferase class V-fold PLP-dependent enzyme [Actinokineospora diospyrosa]MCP2272944.1 Selenocysteine lyase/Cysteine desulfurase [Actinokineospora diospyrosa]